jgi:hypothetical protein
MLMARAMSFAMRLDSSGLCSVGGGKSPVVIRRTVSASVLDRNGFRPVQHSYKTTPSEY